MGSQFTEQNGTKDRRTAGVPLGTERPGQLATVQEVLDLLRDGGGNFTDLEPIRTRYSQQFGDEQCWVCPVCHSSYLGVVLLPVQEGALCLPYASVASDVMEQFVLEEAHLLDYEECSQLLQELNDQHTSLTAALKSFRVKLDGDRENKRHLETVLKEVEKYIFEVIHCASVQQPINDISRELVQAMAEAYGAPVFLGIYGSGQLTPYTGQYIRDHQYNFCVPVDDAELKTQLRFAGHSALEFDRAYQLLKSLGGHNLFWR